MIARARRFLALGALIVSAPASAADPTEAIRAAARVTYEYMLRVEVFVSCTPSQTADYTAYLESAGDALGRATFEQLWMQFDMVDPTQHFENGKRADETLQRLIVDADRRVEQLFQEKGCAAVEEELKALQ